MDAPRTPLTPAADDHGNPTTLSAPGGVGAGGLASAVSGRYLLGKEIARGGMGAVHRATDAVLGREVALKLMHEPIDPEAALVRRFNDEARITATLQHPGIPPVHDLGLLPDGRPFLAMKLIKGDTLEELLKARPDPGHDRWRFVAIFEAICQAVGYAHSRCVIHRDLKPANVMVGAFGEVQVMDWGLAKVLSERPTDDPGATAPGTLILAERGDVTQDGSMMGTPAFMPPEQAIGAVAKVGPRSDVFGLGAILAAILTGEPPFPGRSATARVSSAQGDLTGCFARLDGCGSDAGLVALCKRCLAARPDDRPADGGEVARAVAALRQQADERARRAEAARQRAGLWLMLALALGVIVIGGTMVRWTMQAQAFARDLDRLGAESAHVHAAASALDLAEAALRSGDAGAATRLLAEARRRAAQPGAELMSERLEGLERDHQALLVLDKADLFRWTPQDGTDVNLATLADRYREGLATLGADPDAVPPAEVAARVARSAIRDRLIAALDHMLRYGRSARVREALRAAEREPFRDEVRDAVAAGDRKRLAELAGRTDVGRQPPWFVAFVAGRAAVSPEVSRGLLEEAVRRRPNDLGLLMMLGLTYPSNQKAGAEERLRWFQAAVSVAPGHPSAHNCLGIALRDKGLVDDAIASFRRAIELGPGHAPAHYNLGVALADKGRWDDAIASYQVALRLDPKDAMAHCNLGLALRRKGRLAESLANLRRGHEFGSARPGWPFPSARWVRTAERLVALEARLPAVLSGDDRPGSAAESCALADICLLPTQAHYTAAFRLYQQALSAPKADPRLAAAHRYNAACAAARVAHGDGVDATAATDEPAALRGKALSWLRGDLALWQARADSPNPATREAAAKELRLWMRDPDLSSVRPGAALPDAERAAWEALWADVLRTYARAVTAR